MKMSSYQYRKSHCGDKTISVFKLSAGPGTLTSKIWVGPASFPSLSKKNFGKIMLQSGKFQILFWRLKSYDCLISTVAFPLLVRWHLYSESVPSFLRTDTHTSLSTVCAQWPIHWSWWDFCVNHLLWSLIQLDSYILCHMTSKKIHLVNIAGVRGYPASNWRPIQVRTIIGPIANLTSFRKHGHIKIRARKTNITIWKQIFFLQIQNQAKW